MLRPPRRRVSPLSHTPWGYYFFFSFWFGLDQDSRSVEELYTKSTCIFFGLCMEHCHSEFDWGTHVYSLFLSLSLSLSFALKSELDERVEGSATHPWTG